MATAITPFSPSNNNLFVPTQISGLSLWLDAADSSSVIRSGSSVTAWNDKSGNGRNATGVATRYPTYDVTNRRIVFNGTNQYLSNIGFSFNISQRSIFIVFQQLTYTLYTGVLPIIPSPTSGTDYQATTGMTIETSGGVRFYQNSGGYQNDIVTTTPVALGIYYEQMSGTAGATYRNGNLNSNRTANFTAGSCGGYAVGCRWSGAPTTPYLNGYMNEVIIFNRALTNTQRQNIEGYLAWKWNIQRSLPTTHPYYNNAYLSNSYPITYFPSRLNPTTVVPTVPGFTIPLTIRQYIWEPTGMALWLDASDKATITPSAGGTISAWLDKSGNNKNPTFEGTTTYNAVSNTVFTTGSSYFYSAVDTRKTTVTNMTLFLVHRQTNNTNPTNQGLWGNDIGGGWNRFQILNFVATPELTYAISAGGAGIYYNVPNLNSLNRLLYTCQYSLSATNGSYVNINGTNSVTFTEIPAQSQTETQNTYFGTIDTGINGAVEFYEIILYTTNISTQQRQELEGYLAWKWGLQRSLPSSHPFFNFPPG